MEQIGKCLQIFAMMNLKVTTCLTGCIYCPFLSCSSLFINSVVRSMECKNGIPLPFSCNPLYMQWTMRSYGYQGGVILSDSPFRCMGPTLTAPSRDHHPYLSCGRSLFQFSGRSTTRHRPCVSGMEYLAICTLCKRLALLGSFHIHQGTAPAIQFWSIHGF